MSVSPNMGLTEPTPGVGGTPGPQWASELNTNLEIIDAHDHAGTGVPIPSAGIGIDADLPFNSFSATGLLTAQFTSQVSAPSPTAAISVVGGELTYKDSSGNVVAITSGGSVAGATGTITNLAPYNDGVNRTPSAVFSGVTKSFTWLYDSARSARMASADLILYPYDGSTSYTNSITIKAPTSLAAAYSITFPGAVPTQTNVVSMSTSGVLTTGVVSGTAGAPSLAFAAELTTGIYRPGSSEIGFATSGVQRASFNDSGIRLISGTDAAPSYSFLSDTNTGIYLYGTDQIGFAANGVGSSIVDSAGVKVLAGAAATPSLSFITDPDTGFYSAGSDGGEIRAATQGVLRANFNNSGIRLIDGTTSEPSYSFISDTNTGLYSDGADSLAVTTGGTTMVGISAEGMFCGTAATASKIKWKVFTGTLAASGSVDLTCPGTTILGAVGWSSRIGGGSYVIMDASGGLANRNYFDQTSSLTEIRVSNSDATNSNSYRVLMYYQ